MQEAPSNFDKVTRKNWNENESYYEVWAVPGESIVKVWWIFRDFRDPHKVQSVS